VAGGNGIVEGHVDLAGAAIRAPISCITLSTNSFWCFPVMAVFCSTMGDYFDAAIRSGSRSNIAALETDEVLLIGNLAQFWRKSGLSA
jgi:hypothetical protein